MGVLGAVVLVILGVGSVFYRTWKYEQELDRVLWKIEYKDLQLEVMDTMTDRIHRARPITSQRNSQVSLSSNPEADFR